MELNNQMIADTINQEFQGIDQLALVSARMDQMDKTELKQFTLVTLNKLATAMKGSDYDGVVDATRHLSRAIQHALMSYDSAKMNTRASSPFLEGNS